MLLNLSGQAVPVQYQYYQCLKAHLRPFHALCKPHQSPSPRSLASTLTHFYSLAAVALGMLLRLFHLVSLPWSLASPLSLQGIRREPVLHLPLFRREVSTGTPRRLFKQDAIGLGDYIDVCVLKSTTGIISSQNQDIQRTSPSG